MVECPQTLLLIDQHAAHERILFDQLTQRPPESQLLLTPIVLDVTQDEYDFILTQQEDLANQGIIIKTGPENNNILIVACPAEMTAEFWEEVVKGQITLSLKKELFASMACKHAIKEGEKLDPITAKQLIQNTLDLKEPFCPHGRPLWIELSEQQLYQWIKRNV